MAFLENHVLTLVTFLPVVGMLIVLAIRSDATVNRFAVWWSLIPLALSSWLWLAYDQHTGGFQFEFLKPWIAPFGVNYHLGVDGFSIPMIFLTALLSTICLWYSSHVI